MSLGEKQAVRILVAVDSSECSKRAVRWALKYVKERQNPDDVVDLLHVLNTAKPHWYDPLHDKLDGVWNDAVKEAAKALHDETKLPFEENNVKFEWVQKEGDPRDTIVDQLKEKEYTQLVMGRRGLSAVQSMLLGSVSDYLLKNATIPVTIVP